MYRTPIFGTCLLAFLACFLLLAFAGLSFGMDRQGVKRILREEAAAVGVPVPLALAVAKVESGFRPDAVSPVGARGVMQVMPATAKGEFNVSEDRLFDPRTNIRLGLLFLRQLYKTYGARWDFALSHYNGGTLRRRNGRPVVHGYTQGYLDKVLTWTRHYKGAEGVSVASTAEPGQSVRQPEPNANALAKTINSVVRESVTADVPVAEDRGPTTRYRALSSVDCRLVAGGGAACNRPREVLIVEAGSVRTVYP